MSPGQMSLWQLESVLDVPRNLPVKFHQNRVSNSWDIPDMDICREDKCCVDKCHPDTVLKIHRNLPLKFHQNRVSNSWDIADIEFLWVSGGWGMQSLFIVKPNLVLRWGWGFDKKSESHIWVNLTTTWGLKVTVIIGMCSTHSKSYGVELCHILTLLYNLLVNYN